MMDKWVHFIISAMIALFGAALTFVPPNVAAMALVTAVAFAKEGMDWATGKGIPKVNDIIAGIGGGLAALIIIEAITG